jgi:hypothetical protein
MLRLFRFSIDLHYLSSFNVTQLEATLLDSIIVGETQWRWGAEARPKAEKLVVAVI